MSAGDLKKRKFLKQLATTRRWGLPILILIAEGGPPANLRAAYDHSLKPRTRLAYFGPAHLQYAHWNCRLLLKGQSRPLRQMEVRENHGQFRERRS